MSATSRRIPTGPIPGLSLRWPLPVAIALLTLGFALAWRFLPVGVAVSITIFVLLVGLVVVTSFVARLAKEAGWTHSEFAEIGRVVPSGPPGRAEDLVQWESVVAGAMRYEHDLYLKVRPQVRYLAWARLAARGIDLDRDPRAAAELGALYEFVKADAYRPGRLFGPGTTLETLEQMTESLECL